MKKKIKEALSKLILLELTEGVQPSDITDNIFLKEYKEIKLIKEKENIILELVLSSGEDFLSMRYTYSNKKFLMKIVEVYNGLEFILWDRVEEEKNIISDIKEIFLNQNEESKLYQFINTLPEHLKRHFIFAELAA